MTGAEAAAFSREWAAAWSRKDMEAVLAHFREDACFTSPKALATVGVATVEGKAALRTYWTMRALQVESIHFAVDRAVWDEARQELVVVYDATINGQSTRACEFLRFDERGLVTRGEAMYGVAL